MITLNTDIKLEFDQLRQHYMNYMDGHKEELNKIIEKAINSFDFEKVMTEYVHEAIREALYNDRDWETLI